MTARWDVSRRPKRGRDKTAAAYDQTQDNLMKENRRV